MRSKTPRNNFWTTLCAAAATTAAAALSPLAGLAQQPRISSPDAPAAVQQLEKTLVDIIARAEPSVVAIGRTSPQQPAVAERRPGDVFIDLRDNAAGPSAPITVGAGVIIDRTGLVLTHYLAVHEGDQHTVITIDHTTYPATIRAADPRSGLAILAIDPKAGPLQRAGAPSKTIAPDSLPPIKLGDASTVRKGQFVITIGNPYAIQTDGQPTASWGIVTNLARKAPSGTNLNDAPGPGGDYRTTLHHLGTLIQTDAKLGFSAAGGALVNLRGELIGLTTTVSTIAGHEQPAGYAIPINATTRRIIDTLKQGREVEYGMLGVAFGFGQLALDTTTNRGSRLTLVQVFPGGPAARAGLQSGDVVTSVADQPVDDVDSVQLAISKLSPSTTTTVGYTRGGQPATANITLAKLAVTGKKIASVRPDAWRGIRVDYATALEAAELTQAASSGALDPEGCVLVAEVEEKSAAWNAGVRKGMFISRVGGKRVTTPAEFQAATHSVGEKLDIQLTQPVVGEPAKVKRIPPTK
jgi:S1-C subfamily serine protease